MPRHPSWDSMYNSLQKQYCDGSSEDRSPKGGPCRKGDQVFYALLNKHGWDDEKPRPSETANESFQWLEEPGSRLRGQPGMVRIVAINAGTTKNLRIYSPEEILLSGRTLKGKPIYRGRDHIDKTLIGSVLWSEPEDDRVEALGYVDEDTWNWIKEEGARPGSIECEYLSSTQLNGEQLHNVTLDGYLIIDGDTQPGDPGSFVEAYETRFIPYSHPSFEVSKTDPPETQSLIDSGQEEETLSETDRRKGQPKTDRERLIDHYGEEKATQLITLVGDDAYKLLPERGSGLEAVWTTAYINDLPDSAFAYIEPGGEEDKEGKTSPRSLRHLPYKDKKGNIDVTHLRNALARLPQTKISSQAKAKAKTVLCRAARSKGLDFPACETSSGTEKEEKKLSENMEKLQETLDKLTEQIQEINGKLEKEAERISGEFSEVSKRIDEIEKKIPKKATLPMGEGAVEVADKPGNLKLGENLTFASAMRGRGK